MKRLSSECVFESVCLVCRPAGVHSSAAAFSSEPLLERSEAQVVSMSSSDWNSVFSLLLLSVLFHPAKPNIFFPVETIQESVHYRSLRDILFRSQTEAIAFPVDSSVIASFQPADPSPTLASPPGVGVSKIRFLESDAFFGPPLYHPNTNPEFISPALVQAEGRRPNVPSAVAVNPVAVARQPKSAAVDISTTTAPTSGEPVEDDRWPWPYSKPSKQPVTPQSRQIHKLTSPLVVKKSVAKPYRLLSRTSTCPKLLHDLTITCSLPKQQFPPNQPVVRLPIQLLLQEPVKSQKKKLDILVILEVY